MLSESWLIFLIGHCSMHLSVPIFQECMWWRARYLAPRRTPDGSQDVSGDRSHLRRTSAGRFCFIRTMTMALIAPGSSNSLVIN